MDGLRIAIIAVLLVLALALAAQAAPLEGNNCLAAAASVKVTR
jgi:hypothetical protein